MALPTAQEILSKVRPATAAKKAVPTAAQIRASIAPAPKRAVTAPSTPYKSMLPAGGSPLFPKKTPAPAPAAPKAPVLSFSDIPAPRTATANSTPQTTKTGTARAVLEGVKKLNPLRKVEIEPAFSKPGQSQTTYGGPIVAGAHDIAARMTESVVASAARLAAEFDARRNHKDPTTASIKLPFSASRIDRKLPSDEVRIKGITANMVDEFDRQEKLKPGRTKTNIALAALNGPITDFLNLTLVGGFAEDAARGVLKATRFTPELDRSLQQFGMQGTKLTGEDFTREFTRRFNQKARDLAEAEDYAGLDQLGHATGRIVEALKGRGVPQLTKLGQKLQDAAKFALQDTRQPGGIRLKTSREIAAEIAPEREIKGLPGTREEPGQAPAMGLSTRRMERVGGEEPPKTQVTPFEGLQDVSTRLIEKLKGKTVVSKQFIQDLTNSPDLKQPERDLIRRTLEDESDQVNVAEFANKVKTELLPLTTKVAGSVKLGGDRPAQYEGVTLPEVDGRRGPVTNYAERIYESPIKTEAGSVHFYNTGGKEPVRNYFAHSRIEDLPDETRRVIEIQSDLFQKGRLENEAATTLDYSVLPQEIQAELAEINKRSSFSRPLHKDVVRKREIEKQAKDLIQSKRDAEVGKLEPYRNTWYERVVREEVKQAAGDSKTKLQFPTGETAMRIEGLGGGTTTWRDSGGYVVQPAGLEPGLEITRGGDFEDTDEAWIVTEVLGDGKFKAVPRHMMDNGYRVLNYEGEYKVRLQGAGPAEILGSFGTEKQAEDFIEKLNLKDAESYTETFDISDTIDKENPIYRFYEKTLGRYLTNKYGAKRVTDAQGVEWYEIPVDKKYANAPVEAYGFMSGVQEDDEGNITFNPFMAALGVAGSKALGKGFKGLSKERLTELSRLDNIPAIKTALIAEHVSEEVAERLAPGIALATNEEEVAQVIAGQANLLTAEAYQKTEEGSLEMSAEANSDFDPALRMSTTERERVEDDLISVFADLKGVSTDDLKQTFSDEDLENARMAYEFASDALLDHPGRPLMKYVNSSGFLPDVTRNMRKGEVSKAGQEIKDARGKWEKEGDTIFQNLLGQERTQGGDVAIAQEWVDDYIKYRTVVREYQDTFRNIRRIIRLRKQSENFIESGKRTLARAAAKDLKAIRGLVEAARKTGFAEGAKKSKAALDTLVQRLKDRRIEITAVKKRYNLTDPQMAKIRGHADTRFMSTQEFNSYMKELNEKAAEQMDKNVERMLIGGIIETRELKKAQNLQRAMELPSMNDMTLDELRKFSDALAKTDVGDTFLGPRMIQTAANTDLGAVRTVEEARAKILEQTGMPYADPVEGSKGDRWLRDSTLAARDPLRKIFISDYAAKEADMLTRKYQLIKKLDELASAARASRKRKDASLVRQGKKKRDVRGSLFKRLTPQDKLVVEWLQPFRAEWDDNGKKQIIRMPELRQIAEANMTPQELEYAKFLENMFSHYYDLAQQEALERWTLLGVKHSNYRDMYYAHMNRSFIERWRDEGIMKAFRMMWTKDVAESKIDFNAYGDRGEVLGMEKWLNRSMTREGEGVDRETGKVFYTENAAKVAIAYFHAFERKLILDSMIPKVKMLEFVMGKKFTGPASITNPDGTEAVSSLLRKHTNEWLNNKKGQRVQMIYEQGDKAEAVIDTARTFVAIEHLGGNILAQVISGIGGEAINLAARGPKDYTIGHARAVTKRGRQTARDYSGIIGEAPWRELGNAANDVGDTLRSGLFYIFGDLAYRARRQFFLSQLTPEEFKSGKISEKRVGEIKLELGSFHALPEFRSIAGSTSLVKAAGMYSEWAVPALQHTYFVLIPRLRNLIRRTPKSEWKTVVQSEEFKTLFRMVITGAALGAIGYFVLAPDEDDKSNAGYMRRKAAQEIASTLQAVSLWGIPTPFSIFNGYIENLGGAVKALVTLERYETAGPGHEEGDLKGTEALKKVLIPRGIRQWLPEAETPIKTEDEIADELREDIESGRLDNKGATDKLKAEIKKRNEALEKKRFKMDGDEYADDLRARREAGEDPAKLTKELKKYIKYQKETAPESFESKSDASFIDKIGIAAKAVGTDPVTLFQAIFTEEKIRRMDNGAIILYRGKTSDDETQRKWSLEKRKEFGANKDLILDHTIPLELGGDNGDDNLKLVPKAAWKRYSPVENYLGMALRNKKITESRARELILAFKNGEMDEDDIYNLIDNGANSETSPK